MAPPSLPSSSTFSFKVPLSLAPQQPHASTSTQAPCVGEQPQLQAQATTPAQKQRRTSLALPSSPRVVPAWHFRDDTSVAYDPARRGKVRRLDAAEDEEAGDEDDRDRDDAAPAAPEKKARRKWTAEETQMLVDGCNIHGVGNWKTILSDPNLSFANRSPVDLKDRFRTYFPEAYRTHYPNARTHLPPSLARATSPSSSPFLSSLPAAAAASSSSLGPGKPNRSTHPDGTPLFPLPSPAHPKRRPFTPEEDAALLAGFRRHGAAWAVIAKDAPVFGVTGRRSMDLRDRFRNAWPGEYERAGYKARPKAGARAKAKSKVEGGDGAMKEEDGGGGSGAGSIEEVRGRGRVGRAKTDEGLGRLGGVTTSPGGGEAVAGVVGAVRRRRRAHTSQGFKTGSMPPSVVGSEDEGDGGGAASDFGAFGRVGDFGGFATGKGEETALVGGMRHLEMGGRGNGKAHVADVEVGPDEAMPDAPAPSTSTPSKFQAHRRQEERAAFGMGMPGPAGNASGGGGTIGRSAWGTQDWFSPNPRLDSSTNTSTSFAPGPRYPASPPLSSSASFPAGPDANGFFELAHGVLERYDLEPAAAHHTHTHLHHHHAHAGLGFSGGGGGGQGAQWSSPALSLQSFDALSHHSHSVSEAGTQEFDEDSSVAASEPAAWGGGGGGFRGFTHHSNTAGDLIFGARTHQPIWSGVDAWGAHARGLAGIAEAKRGDGEGDAADDDDTDDKALSLFSLDDLVDLPPEVDGDMGLGGSGGMGSLGMGMEGIDVDALQPGTPPAAPARTVHVHHHHHHHHHYAAPAPGAHARSVSVPPGEGPEDLPLGLGLMSAPATPAMGGARAMTLDPALLSAAGAPSLYNLPFLDLHYFGGNTAAAGQQQVQPGARGGEALDLARGFAFAQPAPPQQQQQPPPVVWKAMGLPASLRQHIPARPLMRSMSGGAVGPRLGGSAGAGGSLGGGAGAGAGAGAAVPPRSPNHQRGQSAVVRPADLVISSNGTGGSAGGGPKGKRKRASWDGGGW